MRLVRGELAALLPHRGRMCLIDEVVSWDAARICCRTRSHRDADNPLRSAEGLGAACAIEYAAQAMALHAALAGASAPGVSLQGDAPAGAESAGGSPDAARVDEPATPGLPPGAARVDATAAPPLPSGGALASVRAARLGGARLDSFAEDLEIVAVLASGDARQALYEFRVSAGPVVAAEGRAAVLLTLERGR